MPPRVRSRLPQARRRRRAASAAGGCAPLPPPVLETRGGKNSNAAVREGEWGGQSTCESLSRKLSLYLSLSLSATAFLSFSHLLRNLRGVLGAVNGRERRQLHAAGPNPSKRPRFAASLFLEPEPPFKG